MRKVFTLQSFFSEAVERSAMGGGDDALEASVSVPTVVLPAGLCQSPKVLVTIKCYHSQNSCEQNG